MLSAHKRDSPDMRAWGNEYGDVEVEGLRNESRSLRGFPLLSAYSCPRCSIER